MVVFLKFSVRDPFHKFDNFTGSLMLAIGISFVIIFYLQEGYYVSTFLTMPNYLYWIVVVVSLLRNRK